MKKQINNLIVARSPQNASWLILFISLIGFFCLSVNGDDNLRDKNNDDKILDQFINANKNSSAFVIFDHANIKQYWVDNSVFAKDNTINVLLSNDSPKKRSSVPQRIQLANVDESMDCKIDIISCNDIVFSVFNGNNKEISHSEKEKEFLDYHITSALFHLEDTPDMSFKIVFQAEPSEESASIKKIVLSFTSNKNSNFLFSPGTMIITKDNSVVSSGGKFHDDGDFFVSGKSFIVSSKKNIVITNNTVTVTAKVKNIGKTRTVVNFGFIPFSRQQFAFTYNTFPYKGINKILKVVEFDPDNNTILVDSYSDWAENCYIELNPDINIGDTKKVELLSGRVKEIRKKADGSAAILLSQSIRQKLKPGDTIRINGTSASQIYSSTKMLLPGQEEVFSSSIKKDLLLEEFSNNAFSKYFHYVKPMIKFRSREEQESEISITDFSIDY